MGVFDDLGVMVDGLEDDNAEEYEGGVEEIFRFDVYITPDQEIEIGVNIQELEVDGFPEFGEEYGMLAHVFADLIVQHVGIGTENLMNAVRDLPDTGAKLSEEDMAALADETVNENGSTLLYSFPVLVMEAEGMDAEDADDAKQLGTGFNRSMKADVMLRMYGQAFAEAEEAYQESVTDAILDHGILFMKAVEGIQKL